MEGSHVKKRLRCIAFAALIAAVVSCSQQEHSSQEGIEGYWEGTLENQENTYVIEIGTDDTGKLSGMLHILEGNMKTSEAPMQRVGYKQEHIIAVMHTIGLRFEGDLYPKKQTITGKFVYADESSRPIVLKRARKSSVDALSARSPSGKGGYRYEYRRPEETGDGWETSSLYEEGVNDTMIQKLIREIVDGKYGLVNSLIMVIHGKLVLEEYFFDFTRETLRPLSSCTKSVTSLLVGIAIDRGSINGVREKLLTFFPEYSYLWGTKWEQVQLDHILTMTAGVGWDERSLGGFYQSGDYFKSVFERPIEHEPGEFFEYVSPNTDLLAGVIKTATGTHADEFAAKYLFAPLGIETYNWDKLKQNGYPLVDGTLEMLPRDVAKIGYVMLNRGSWKEQRIVSEEWILESAKARITTPGAEYYGYLWWSGHEKINKKYIEIVFASGVGSQFIIIVPSADLVVVITGNNYSNMKSALPFEMLPEHILPAVL